jgi:membrane-bound lytic murein transglycosylase MltF
LLFAAAVSLRGFAQSSAAQSKTPVVAPPTATKQWTGDLDVLLKHQIIRVGVPYSKTLYYTVKGTQYGVAYEGGKAFEEYLNKKYRRQQQKNVRIYVIFIVTPRDEAVVNLDNGNLDILIGNLIITPERQKLVDFSNPTVNGVNEIVVSGPNSPQLASVDDLSGKEVFARKTSSYWEHLEQLNARFQKQKKTAVKLRAVPEDLSDEDLLQMVNAGLLQTIVVNDWTAKLWSQLLTKLQVHSDISVASGQALGWAVRKDSPKLLAVINEFLKTHRQGTAFGNRVLTEYTGSYSPPLFIVPKLTRRFVHHHRTAFHSILRVICVQQERHPHLNSRSLLKTAPSSFTPNSSIPLTIHSLRIQTPTLHRRPLASSVARL